MSNENNYKTDSGIAVTLDFVQTQLKSLREDLEKISAALFKNGEHLNLVSRMAIVEMRLMRQETDINENNETVKKIRVDLNELPDKIKANIEKVLDEKLAESRKNYVDWKSFGLALFAFIFSFLGIFIKSILD